MKAATKPFVLVLVTLALIPLTLAAKSADQKLDEGRAALGRGDLQGARLWFEDVLRKRPKNLKARVLLGVVHDRLGAQAAKADDWPAAVTELRQAVKLDPSEAYWHAALARALNQQGDDDGAVHECAAAAQLSPDDSGLISGCGLKSRLPSEPKRQHPEPELIEGVRSASGITAPVSTYQPSPPYSEKARQAKYQAFCSLMIVIGTAGNVEGARVVRAAGLGLDQNALQTVRTWTFRPAIRDGVPVRVRVIVEVSFRLN